MLQAVLSMLEWLLWIAMVPSALYIFVFALGSLKRRKTPARPDGAAHGDGKPRFLVLFPAYGEDRVICRSVETFLQQDYPADRYRVAVISDHQTDATNERLSQLPITLHQPVFDRSSKARAMQYALAQVNDSDYDYVVVLDADNVVLPTFLQQLSAAVARYQAEVANSSGRVAIQCHRTAKNVDSDIAMLDGASEEINNSIFRRGHNRLGLSSALIGSGMCFSLSWFRENVNHLTTAGEDRELEALLLRQRIFIRYEEDILVMDEKVATGENFQRQRLRWMSAQVQCLLAMLPHLPDALVHGNIDYADKTVQQALLPRSILLVGTTAVALLVTVVSVAHSVKWWLLLLVVVTAVFVATPSRLRTKTLLSKALIVPRLVGRMMSNILHIDRRNKDFIHTTHDHSLS